MRWAELKERSTKLMGRLRSGPGRETAVKSSILFGCRIAAMATRIIISPLTANILGTSEYGSMSFALNVITYMQIIFTLGMDSAPRLAAQTDSPKEQGELVGTYVLLFAVWGVLFGLVLWAMHGWVDSVFAVDAGELFGLLAPIAIIIPISVLTEWLLRGLGRIRLLGYAMLFPSLLYLLGVIWLSYQQDVTAGQVLLVRYLTIAVVQIGVLALLKPRLTNLRHQAKRIWGDFRAFGWRVYTGRIPAALADCSQLALGYFVSAETIAYYNIALALSAPVELVGTSYAQTLYRGMIHHDQLHPQQRWTSALVSAATAIGVPLAGTLLIVLAYPADFRQAIPLLFLLSAGRAFRGGYALYNQYLSSHGAGNIMRRVSLIGAAVEIVATLLLVYLFGVYGAAVSLIIYNCFTLAQYVINYHRFSQKIVGMDVEQAQSSNENQGNGE